MPIPVHPQPSFYETTVAVVGEHHLVGPREVETICARPGWDYAKANSAALTKINAERLARKEAAKKAAATRRANRAAKKTAPPAQ